MCAYFSDTTISVLCILFPYTPEEDALAGDSKIVVQFQCKYETSTKKSEQVQILAILPQKLSVRDKNSLGHQIT
jgi:hypothetical protein